MVKINRYINIIFVKSFLLIFVNDANWWKDFFSYHFLSRLSHIAPFKDSDYIFHLSYLFLIYTLLFLSLFLHCLLLPYLYGYVLCYCSSPCKSFLFLLILLFVSVKKIIFVDITVCHRNFFKFLLLLVFVSIKKNDFCFVYVCLCKNFWFLFALCLSLLKKLIFVDNSVFLYNFF